MDTPDPDFCGKSAEELQKEGREIEAWGGFVYRVHPAQVATMVEYQIPHIVIEQIPTSGSEGRTGSGTEGQRPLESRPRSRRSSAMWSWARQQISRIF